MFPKFGRISVFMFPERRKKSALGDHPFPIERTKTANYIFLDDIIMC